MTDSAEIEAVGRLRTAVAGNKPFLWLPPELHPLPAADLDDASLVKWSRWALALIDAHYEETAAETSRSVMEVVTQHGVIAWALLALKTNAQTLSADVSGITFKGEPKGDWNVTVRRTDISHSPEER